MWRFGRCSFGRRRDVGIGSEGKAGEVVEAVIEA